LIKKSLADPARNWRLEKGENKDTWIPNELKDGKKIEQLILYRSDNLAEE
jgi:hypothetical protein